MTQNASPIILHPGRVTLAELRRIHAGPVQLVLDVSARAGLQKSLATVQRIVDEDQEAAIGRATFKLDSEVFNS